MTGERAHSDATPKHWTVEMAGHADARPASVQSVGAALPDTDASATEALLPSGMLRRLGTGFVYLDRLLARWVSDPLNPLLHTGAIAVTMLFIATATGILLLIWYKPSVHLAYDSLEAIAQAPFGSGLVRSLHRYSSDAAVFFAAIHALRFFLERRFEGARWLAWVTGALMMGLLWFIGWTGYWLVWDLRAQFIALGSAKMIDILPLFDEPLSRSFVTDDSVNSLLFFVVFFIHMIVPLAMAVAMWLHITRLARARYLTSKAMTFWVTALLLFICIAYPATNEARAQMTAIASSVTMDWWFLFPMPLIDRLGAGALWSLLIAGSAATFTIPWWLKGRRKPPASVIASRCNDCRKCYADCPYEAIAMIPRTDGSDRHLAQASVIDSKCVACGICAGSCDTMGIGLDWFSSIEQRRLIGSWLKHAEDAGEAIYVAFVCAESAGAKLEIDRQTGLCAELPGYRVLRVPCVGWVQPLMIERAIRHGAGGVLVVSCPPEACAYREGAEWERLRIEGARLPALRSDRIDTDQVRLVALDRTRKAELIRAAAHFRAGEAPVRAPRRPRALQAAIAALLLIASAGLLGLVSDFTYVAPRIDGSQFVVSLRHPGVATEHCRDLTPEEIASTPVHMRTKQVCERTRPPVRLRVSIDGKLELATSVEAAGIWKDGNSVSVERIPVAAGTHRVSVAIGETSDPDEWRFRDEKTLSFTREARRVVIFDRVTGFSWH
jgi:coenzyme F420-reducing hydrogenase delta subunit/Pyruvate/2-oxoacid:ferredoxin oxidoreductase delta subunit